MYAWTTALLPVDWNVNLAWIHHCSSSPTFCRQNLKMTMNPRSRCTRAKWVLFVSIRFLFARLIWDKDIEKTLPHSILCVSSITNKQHSHVLYLPRCCLFLLKLKSLDYAIWTSTVNHTIWKTQAQGLASFRVCFNCMKRHGGAYIPNFDCSIVTCRWQDIRINRRPFNCRYPCFVTLLKILTFEYSWRIRSQSNILHVS